MRQKRSNNDEFSILTRVFDPNSGSITPTAAKAFLDLDFRPEDRKRLAELAAKAQTGKLTVEEQTGDRKLLARRQFLIDDQVQGPRLYERRGIGIQVFAAMLPKAAATSLAPAKRSVGCLAIIVRRIWSKAVGIPASGLRSLAEGIGSIA